MKKVCEGKSLLEKMRINNEKRKSDAGDAVIVDNAWIVRIPIEN